MATSASSSRTVEVERTVAAPPEKVWALISDVTRMGEWSPETTGAAWSSGASGPAVGAKFRGTNQSGSKKWSSECLVTACEPGRRFAFDVRVGPMKVAAWSYEFAPAEGGCTVTERWDDRRGAFIKLVSPFATGVKDRAEHNRQTMTATLQRLAAVAEGAAG